MSFVKKLLTAGAAAAVLSGAANAQLNPMNYAHHWMTQSEFFGTGVILPDIVAFTFPGFVVEPAGPGDAIRRCYGTDTTQGGRNESQGILENSWMRLVQGYGAGAVTQAAQVGLLSIQVATDSDMNGDPCFSPWFASTGNTGGHAIAAATIFGNFGAPGTPVPTFWIVVAWWVGTTTTNFYGVTGPVTVGTAGTGPLGAPNPLLVNTIFEIQGPLNAGDRQYYIATTGEVTGSNGGGVTNGNPGWGSSLFGVGAATSGAISHTRIFGYDPPSQTLAAGILSIAGVGQTEVIGTMAFNGSTLWGLKNGFEGAGGNDPQVSVDPVSVVDLRLNDLLAGAQTNDAGTPGDPTDDAAGFDACIVFNQSIFVWSNTPAATMPQGPFSWSDLGGVVPVQPGSVIIGPVFTSREGPQLIPIEFDAVTALVFQFPGFSVGTPYSHAADFFADGGGGIGTVGANYIFFEGLTIPISSGVSNFSGGPAQLVSVAKPGLAGAQLGVAGCTMQANACTGAIRVAEVASSLQLSLQ